MRDGINQQIPGITIGVSGAGIGMGVATPATVSTMLPIVVSLVAWKPVLSW